MKLVVLRRCVLESRLGPEEWSARLRRSTHRLQPPFRVWKPFVGRVSADRFSVRAARKRTLVPRANGSFAAAPGGSAEIRLELGVAILELVPFAMMAAIFASGFLASGADVAGLVLALVSVACPGVLAYPVLRWNRPADQLVACLRATCEAGPAQLAGAFG